jgi:hypothetical protein
METQFFLWGIEFFLTSGAKEVEINEDVLD